MDFQCSTGRERERRRRRRRRRRKVSLEVYIVWTVSGTPRQRMNYTSVSNESTCVQDNWCSQVYGWVLKPWSPEGQDRMYWIHSMVHLIRRTTERCIPDENAITLQGTHWFKPQCTQHQRMSGKSSTTVQMHKSWWLMKFMCDTNTPVPLCPCPCDWSKFTSVKCLVLTRFLHYTDWTEVDWVFSRQHKLPVKSTWGIQLVPVTSKSNRSLLLLLTDWGDRVREEKGRIKYTHKRNLH